jgi:uncharacterized membrane protein YebE (DUF533 family)
MASQTTPPDQAGTGPSTREAFVCLLVASARADGTVSPHEANQIEQAIAPMRLFHEVGYQARLEIFANAAERVRNEGVTDAARAAAQAIPNELRCTAFAVAVDLMLSDRWLTAGERRFVDQLRDSLEIDREMAVRVVEVLAIKNAG